MKYSIIVPCYNEEGNIKNLVSHFEEVEATLREDGFELILVDNGSADQTSERIDEAIEAHDFIRKVTVEVNTGYGNGILQGLAAGQGDYLGWLHADLQIEPSNILRLVNELKNLEINQSTNIKGEQIEKGELQDATATQDETTIHAFFRGRRQNRPLSDRFFTWGMGCYESLLLHAHLYDINAQPTLMPRELYEEFRELAPSDFSLDLFFYYVAVKKGYEIVRVPVQQQERTEGESTWNTGMSSRIKLVKRTLSYSKTMKQELKNKGI